MRYAVCGIPALLLLAALPLGCSDVPGDELAGGNSPDSTAPTSVVDSILPIDEEIRRFREEVGEDAAALTGGAESRDELVAGFMRALETRDTSFLAGAALGPAEFIDLYFPSSVYTRPPYQMDPAAIWFQMQNNSSRGLSRAFTRYGGREIGFSGYTCPGEPLLEGENRIWEGCVVRIGVGADAAEIRLFGPIIERAGRFNFVTYGNQL